MTLSPSQTFTDVDVDPKCGTVFIRDISDSFVLISQYDTQNYWNVWVRSWSTDKHQIVMHLMKPFNSDLWSVHNIYEKK